MKLGYLIDMDGVIYRENQLMSCLILRAYLKTTYRGVLDFLGTSQTLRASLGLTDKLPHFTTLQKFSARSQVVAIVQKVDRQHWTSRLAGIGADGRRDGFDGTVGQFGQRIFSQPEREAVQAMG